MMDDRSFNKCMSLLSKLEEGLKLTIKIAEENRAKSAQKAA
jgi:hypothetical protein